MSGRSRASRGLTAVIVLLLALAAGGLIALSPDIALPLAVLLLPGLLALIVDRTPSCGVARAILLFQGAACVHPVSEAWYRCAGIDGCMSYLTEWSTVVWVWLAAAAAWLVVQTVPLGLKLLGEHRLQYRRSVLITRRAALASEWGLDDTTAE